MTIYVGVVSQKGGVGISTLCRLLARGYAVAGWEVMIADMDTRQGTCVDMKRRRDSAGISVASVCRKTIEEAVSLEEMKARTREDETKGDVIEPPIAVERFSTVNHAVCVPQLYDLMIFDASPHSQSGTVRIARQSSAILLPTGLALYDLYLSVLFARELVKQGIPSKRMAFVLSRVGDRENEIEEAREYITEAGCFVLDGAIPERTEHRRTSDERLALTVYRRAKTEGLVQSAMNLIERNNKG